MTTDRKGGAVSGLGSDPATPDSRTCADARCEHPKGWHFRGIGSCLECGCHGWRDGNPTLLGE